MVKSSGKIIPFLLVFIRAIDLCDKLWGNEYQMKKFIIGYLFKINIK